MVQISQTRQSVPCTQRYGTSRQAGHHPEQWIFSWPWLQLSYPRLILPCMRLMRGEPYTFLLLSRIILHCNLVAISAQRSQSWAIPSGSTGPVCARLQTHLGHRTPTMKSCSWCFSRETQGTSIIWLCTASFSLQLSFQMWCQQECHKNTNGDNCSLKLIVLQGREAQGSCMN